MLRSSTKPAPALAPQNAARGATHPTPLLAWVTLARRATALALILTLAGTGLCLAQDRPTPPPKQPAKPVDIRVLVIRGTTKNKDVAPELREIADALKSQFKYTGFSLEGRTGGQAVLKDAISVSLVRPYEARITPLSVDGKRIQVQVEILKGKERTSRASVTLDAGKFGLIGGPPLEGGDVLILAVSAR